MSEENSPLAKLESIIEHLIHTSIEADQNPPELQFKRITHINVRVFDLDVAAGYIVSVVDE